MSTKKIILSILGLIIILGFGFVAIKSSNKITKDGNVDNSIEIPVKPAENPINNSAEFGEEVVFKLNDRINFPGLIVILKAIDDSRCPEGVQCIWAGELSATLEISEIYIGGLPKMQEINIGTTVNKTFVFKNYTFSLKDITTTKATILVEYKKPVVISACYVGGCSAQICSDQKDVGSTCEYRKEYACYKMTKCERQTDGRCGWTETAELKKCLLQ